MSDKKSFTEQETRFSGQYASTVLETLWISYRPYLWQISLCCILGMTGRLALLANANVIGYWVDSFCTGPNCRPLPNFLAQFNSENYIALMLGISTLGFCFVFIFRILFSHLSAKAVSQIYDETTYRTSRQPMSFFDSTPAGRIVTRFSSDYGNVFRLFGGPLAELLAIVFDLIAMILLITIASPWYLPLVFLIAGFDFILFRLNATKLRAVRRSLSASRSPSIAHFSETTQGANTIRSFLKQKSFSDRFLRLDQDYLNKKLGTTKSVLWFSFQINTATALFLLAAGLLAWKFLATGHLSVGSIGVAFGFIALSSGTVQMFFEWLAQFEEAMVGVERLDNYIRRPLEPGAFLPSTAKFETGHPQHSIAEEQALLKQSKVLNNSATVEFQNLWFRYRPDLPAVLKGLNFQIAAGEKIGIVGRTGSGKSSLIQALFHLYPIEKGKILIDNKGAEDIDLELFRKSIAFIAQDPTLFRGTLRENLDVNHEHPDQDLFESLTQVGLEKWATSNELKHKIEERGRNLSLGERQLICMARCLLQNAPVIVMDEATSSVDPQSEEILVRATEEFFQGKTQLIIAHRLSTLRNCDRILWLQNGEIKMIGKPHEVLPSFQQANLSL